MQGVYIFVHTLHYMGTFGGHPQKSAGGGGQTRFQPLYSRRSVVLSSARPRGGTRRPLFPAADFFCSGPVEPLPLKAAGYDLFSYAPGFCRGPHLTFVGKNIFCYFSFLQFSEFPGLNDGNEDGAAIIGQTSRMTKSIR